MPREQSKNKNRGELRFVRLKNTNEDLIGYVTAKEGHIIMYLPLRIEIDTLFQEGRQILSIQEYLPQSIIDIQEIKIFMSDIALIAPVKWEFHEQYEYVSDFFYGNKHNINREPLTKQKKVTKPEDEKINATKENVISILEALANKKDKPVH